MNTRTSDCARNSDPPPDRSNADRHGSVNSRVDTQADKTLESEFLRLLAIAKPGLTRFCWAMARNEQDAVDLLSDTVLKAWQAFPTLRDPQAFPKFCLTIARREAASFWRRKQRHPEGSADIWTELVADTTPPDVRSDIERLHAALKQLPRKQREAVALFELNGFSLNEIQAVQGGSLSGVKSRIRRGRKRLAELLGAEDHPQSALGKSKQNAAERFVLVISSARANATTDGLVNNPAHPKLEQNNYECQ